MPHLLHSTVFCCMLAAATATEATTVDPCLVGAWRADLEDLAHVFATQMNATSASATGDVQMRVYSDGRARTEVWDLLIDVEMPGMPPMTVTIDGGNELSVTADEGVIGFSVEQFDLVAKADVLGETMEIPVAGGGGILAHGGIGIYGCTDDSLSIEMDDLGKIPRKWHRSSAP